jgi:putative methionine-R-sulfoxide reductase with GAF domain
MSDDYVPSISPEEILKIAGDFIETASSPYSAMEGIVGLLKVSFPSYDWVGIYRMGDDNMLRLGPFRGEPSPHIGIPIGDGICGAAASSKETIIVDDVNADPRYLACSLKTKSEIAVPIKKGEKVLGEIDIDSDKPAAFGINDKKLLEEIAAILAEIM